MRARRSAGAPVERHAGAARLEDGEQRHDDVDAALQADGDRRVRPDTCASSRCASAFARASSSA
jgi:hypothetical protein